LSFFKENGKINKMFQSHFIVILISLTLCFNLSASYPQKVNDDLITVEESIRYTNVNETEGSSTTTTSSSIASITASTTGKVKNDDLVVPIEITEQPTEIEMKLKEVENPSEKSTDLKEQLQKDQKEEQEQQKEVLDEGETTVQPQEGEQKPNVYNGRTQPALTSSEEEQQYTASDEKIDRAIEIYYTQHPSTSRRITMNDFLFFVPVDKVKAIIHDYDVNDTVVHKVYEYLDSNDFQTVKYKVLNSKEVNFFLNFMQRSGLDILEFFEDLWRILQRPPKRDLAPGEMMFPEFNQTTLYLNGKKNVGFDGMIESILDAVPQDRILGRFFDKFERDEQFNKLVDNVRTPVFYKILQRLRDSVTLKKAINEMQRNDIDFKKIFESIQNYLLLGRR